MKRESRLFLEDILESIEKIVAYTREMAREDFLRAGQTQDAVLRRLEVIGEAVKNLPEEIKERYVDVPWRAIAGTRDILAHGYFGIKLERVWAVVEKDLPELKMAIMRIMAEMP